MKKMLAIIVSLLLVFSSISAVAEDDNYTCTLSFDLAIEEILMMADIEMTDAEDALIDAFLPLLKKTDLQVTVVDEQMQFSLVANGMPLASLTAGLLGDQYVIVSDLFPSCYLTLSQEMVQSLLSSSRKQKIDDDDLMKKLGEHFMLALNDMESIVGEAEEGQFMVNEELFTAKIPVNASMEELMLLGMNFLMKVAADPAFAPMLSSAELNMADMLESYAALQQAAQTDPTPCELAVFTRAGEEKDEQEIAVTFATGEENQVFALSMLMLEDETSGYLAIGSNQNASFEAMYEAAASGMNAETVVIEWYTAEYEDDAFVFDASLISSGIALSLKINGQETENGEVYSAAFCFPTPNFPMMTAEITLVEEGKITLPLSTEGKTAISLDALTDDAAQEEEMLQPLLSDIEAFGVNNLLSNLIIALPDDASALLTQIMMLQAMEAQPQEEPAATSAPAGGFMDVIRTTETP